jgi:hypothetical protein
MRQMAREVDRMLPGAAADLDHLGAIGKRRSQDLQNRRPVALAGL